MIEIQWSPALKFFWHCDPCGISENGHESLASAEHAATWHSRDEDYECRRSVDWDERVSGLEDARRNGTLPDLSSKQVGFKPERIDTRTY